MLGLVGGDVLGSSSVLVDQSKAVVVVVRPLCPGPKGEEWTCVSLERFVSVCIEDVLNDTAELLVAAVMVSVGVKPPGYMVMTEPPVIVITLSEREPTCEVNLVGMAVEFAAVGAGV